MKFRDKVPGSGGGNFLKLSDGESVTGFFAGDPHDFFQVWEGPEGKRVSKEVPEGTPDSKFRFRINFVTKEGDKYVPKIFEGNPKTYKKLKSINEEYDLDDTLIKITRHGEKLTTEYDLMPLKGIVSPEAKKTKLLNLKSQEKKETGSSWANDDTEQFAPPPDHSQFAEEDTLPF